MFVTWLVVAVIAALAWRVAFGARVEHAVAARLRPGTSGVVPGAESIDLRDTTRAAGVLLLHGFGDSPQTLSYLAPSLAARGFSVYAPLLPGHGRSLRAFGASTAAEWLAAARDALIAMREDHCRVGIAGLSMGGSLAVLLAAEFHDVAALALLAPYLDLPPTPRRIVRFAPVLSVAVPYFRSRSEQSILDPDERARSLGYGAASPRVLAELARIADRARAALPHVTTPTLYVQSRDDNRLATHVAERAIEALGTQEKRLEWVEGAGHVITVDYARDRVNALVGEWMERYVERGRIGAP